MPLFGGVWPFWNLVATQLGLSLLIRPDLDFFSADALSPIFLACQYTEDTDFPVSSAISDAKWSSYISRTIRFCSSVHVLLMTQSNSESCSTISSLVPTKQSLA